LNPIHSLNITDKYSVSFIFKLNRFPSKVIRKNLTKVEQITTRRTDLLEFSYSNSSANKIEFGAMAPWAYVDGRRTYQGKYNKFSIAASIKGNNGNSTSIYTDYKFELGKEYNVKLEISKTQNYGYSKFGSQDNYEVRMYVNNVVENTAVVKCKVWGGYGKKLKKQAENILNGKNLDNYIASQPNFLPFFVPQETVRKLVSFEHFQVPNNPVNLVYLKDFNFSQLVSITSPPYLLSHGEDPLTRIILLNSMKSRKSLGNHNLYKINNGVDIGSIEIFANLESGAAKKTIDNV
jgi:hypothetical protein